ncbi:hypothetical protein NHL51_09070 [Leucobacter sp. gxy201]|uniref:hypothetical protein n=1 Tax=Leucobacter sp. gxy201 TaxID=2957200 RepID=UPI003DA10E6D
MPFEFEHAAPMGDLVLAVGSVRDLPEIRAWLAGLPADAYGQVLIESCSGLADALEPLAAPAGVAVNSVPFGLEPGEGLARAVTAWLDEWVWAEADIDRSVQMLACDDPSPAMRECWSRVDRKIARRRFAIGATATPVDATA